MEYKSLYNRIQDTKNECESKYNELIDNGIVPHRAEEMSRDGRWNDNHHRN